jgi:hypothetical protein
MDGVDIRTAGHLGLDPDEPGSGALHHTRCLGEISFDEFWEVWKDPELDVTNPVANAEKVTRWGLRIIP